MKEKNPKINAFIAKAKLWREETEKLRTILLDCGLDEELKWGKPGYTYQGKNIAVIQGLKSYFALLFVKGALLKDPKRLLVKPGENTQAGRQMKFKDTQEIAEREQSIREYVLEAVEVEKKGLNVEIKATKEYPVPVELQDKLEESPEFKTAFEALTPGRQREYILYVSSAKQSATRTSRVEKYQQKILDGKGLRDR